MVKLPTWRSERSFGVTLIQCLGTRPRGLPHTHTRQLKRTIATLSNDDILKKLFKVWWLMWGKRTQKCKIQKQFFWMYYWIYFIVPYSIRWRKSNFVIGERKNVTLIIFLGTVYEWRPLFGGYPSIDLICKTVNHSLDKELSTFVLSESSLL